MTFADQTTRPAEPTAHARLSRLLCFSIYSAGHAFNRAYKPLLDPLGLTYPQYLVLLVLWEQDNVTVNEVGQRLFLDSGTLTPLLKRMEAAGFLRRMRDTHDERQVRISLTPAGQRLEEQVLPIMAKLVCAIAQPEARLLELTDEVTRLRTALQQHAERQLAQDQQ